jgi:spore coat polysaccharide biosynthesis protein SpsF
MKIGYLIIGRLKSTRLPKKILLEVEGKPFMEHMFDRVKLSKKTDVIVLCTSTNPQDDPLEQCAKESGVECFRGDEDDVIQRLFNASKKYGLDYILAITADCPLVDPVYADKIVETYEQTQADLITSFDLPHGAYTYGIKIEALGKILEIKDSSDTEVWGRYFTDTGLFDIYALPIENPKHNRPNLRMTLDYPEDYEFFKAVYRGLYKKESAFSLDQIIDFLDANPEVPDINKHCESLYFARYTKQSEIKLKQRFDIKKVIIFGSGSIGQRHIRNLKKLGYSDIAAFRTKQGHFKELPSEAKVKELFDWNDVLDFKPDVAVISNPTSLHVEAAARIAPHVKGVFIEKPLSHSHEGVKEFIDLVRSKNVVSFIGYNLQLHPIVKIIIEEMGKGYLGKPLNFQCQVGQWLPDWHPYEDFQKAYAANKHLGGGVTLTLIHEINLAQRLFGSFNKVAAFFPKSEKLELDVDTISDVMIHHKEGTISQIHLDYIQNPRSRSGSIAFEHGLIRYDMTHNRVSVQFEKEKVPKDLWEGNGYDPNEMYLEELRLFMRYASEGRMLHDFDCAHAVEDLSLVEAAFESEKTGQFMEIGARV